MNKQTTQEKREPSQEVTQVDDTTTREAALQQVRDVLEERCSVKGGPYNAYVSMYTLALTLLQLVELYDNQPGKERRMKVLDELAKEFNRFTCIPRK
jgi:hypothetical protein